MKTKVIKLVVFKGPLGSEDPRLDMGPELGLVQILLNLIGLGQISFYSVLSQICVSICARPRWIRVDLRLYVVHC